MKFSLVFKYRSVSPSVCGQIKCNAEPLLSSFDVRSVELVAFFNCTKSSVLETIKSEAYLYSERHKSEWICNHFWHHTV